MTPGRYNMICPQGATFQQTLTYLIDDVAVNLGGYTAKMQVRDGYNASNFLVGLTSSSGIVITASAGMLDISVAPHVTKAIKPGDYVYDLEITSSGGIVTRLIEGKFSVTPEVTR